MLLNQCIADAEDKITDSGKIVKINKCRQRNGNGRRRQAQVFQNIVDNALNYSMDGTRIFLDIIAKADKNSICREEHFGSPISFWEEILERFVRGISHEQTAEAVGIIRIKESFTETCGGIFNIEMNGDMFKAIVEMPTSGGYGREKTDDKRNM